MGTPLSKGRGGSLRSAAGDAMVASGAATEGLQKPIANPIAIQKVLGFNEKGFKEKPKELNQAATTKQEASH